jgi:hypothetical protein
MTFSLLASSFFIPNSGLGTQILGRGTNLWLDVLASQVEQRISEIHANFRVIHRPSKYQTYAQSMHLKFFKPPLMLAELQIYPK